MRTWLPIVALIPCVTVTCATLAAAQSGAPEFGYRHLDEWVSIEPVETEIAVLAPRLTPAELEDSLEELGLPVTRVIEEPVVGWVRVVHSAPAGNRGAVERALELADVEFASPVFTLDDLPRYVSPWILAGQEEGIADDRFVALVEEQLAAEVETLRLGDLARIHRLRHASRDGFEVLAEANRFEALDAIEHAAPDWVSRGRKHLIPNDTLFFELWGIRNIGQGIGYVFDQDIDGDQAWDTTTGDPSVVIVVFDDGVQTAHPDLNTLAGQDFTSAGTGGQPGNSCDNHGTAVAGCVTAKINNGFGVVGVAPDCRVRSAKIGISDLGSPCPSTFLMFDSWLVSAVGWSAIVGEVSNSSISVGPASAISNAYNSARAAGVIHFASSGNGSATSISYPSSLLSVNAVGALTPSGNHASFSNTGTGLQFSAPGTEIATTDRTGGAGYVAGDYDLFFGGTSAASPYAAGVAALALSVDPSLTVTELEDLMEDSCVDRGVPGYDTTYGWGFVNAKNLLDLVDPIQLPPDLLSITPTAGPVGGGNLVTLIGENFASDAVVLFGTNVAPSVTFVSPTELQVIAPAGASGTADVFLTQASGSDALSGAYFYTDTLLRLESKNAPIGGSVVSRALGTSDIPLAGFSCAAEIDGLYLDILEVSLTGTVAEGAEFFSSDFANSPVPGGTWWICGVVMSFAQTVAIPVGVDLPYVAVTYALSAATPPGSILLLDLVDGGGVPPTDLVFVPSSGISITPSQVDGVLIAIEGGFVRGDSNQDTTVDVADPVYALAFLFTSGPGICPDAMDGNDDGVVDIADPVFVLAWLFSGGPAPPAPFPNEGPDPTPDGLGCQ